MKLQEKYSRLRNSHLMRGGGHDAWRNAHIVLVGAGMLGGRFAIEAARAGAGRLTIFDPQTTGEENTATQLGEPAKPKATSIATQCRQVAADDAQMIGVVGDVRHAGFEVLASADLIVDCTDDVTLELTLTEISNGLAVPLLRIAVDGSGNREYGRVLSSHGGGGAACQLCASSFDSLPAGATTTPCLGADAGPPPTLASTATAMAICGIGLTQAIKIVAGDESALNREILFDLDHMRILPAQLVRSEECISEHTTWKLHALDTPADEATFGSLFELASQAAGDTIVSLSPFNHPLHTAWTCSGCGHSQHGVGTAWMTPPACSGCGRTTRPHPGRTIASVTPETAAGLNIASTPLAQLGLPAGGAVLLAARSHGRALRFVLRSSVAEAATLTHCEHRE